VLDPFMKGLLYLNGLVCLTVAVLIIFTLTGCTSINSLFLIEPGKTLGPEDAKLTRSEEYQKEIDIFLATDAENKKWEKIFLKEIKIAKENIDGDAYRFFLEEYIKIPRLNVPEWMKKEKGYVDGGWYFIDLNGEIRLE
jgi:hypothetical protein